VKAKLQAEGSRRKPLGKALLRGGVMLAFLLAPGMAQEPKPDPRGYRYR